MPDTRGLPLAGAPFYACAMNRPVSAPFRPRPARLAAILLGPALLAACTSAGQFPALTKGAGELATEGRISACGIPVAPAITPAANPAAALPRLPLPDDLAARLAALADQARASHADFESRRQHTADLIGTAAGAARPSDAWSAASVALAELSTARSQTATALADLDQLYNAQRVDGGDGNAIAPVRDQVTAWVADEDAVLAGLEGRLGS